MNKRIAAHGERCLLLVAGQEFCEVIESDPGHGVLSLLKIDGTEKRGLLAEFDGWERVLATKLVKPTGDWVYYADSVNPKNGPTKTAWYTRAGVRA